LTRTQPPQCPCSRSHSRPSPIPVGRAAMVKDVRPGLVDDDSFRCAYRRVRIARTLTSIHLIDPIARLDSTQWTPF
jgi:hypothetical protein